MEQSGSAWLDGSARKALGYQDAFLHTDDGIWQALNGYSPADILAMAALGRLRHHPSMERVEFVIPERKTRI